MKKKNLITLILLFVLLIFSQKPVQAAKVKAIRGGKEITLNGTIMDVKYEGKKVTTAAMKEEAPCMKLGNTVYIPAKLIFSDNTIEASYDYDADNHTVKLKSGDRKITFHPNSKTVSANGTSMHLSAVPYFITFKNSQIKQLYVPAKQTAMFLGLKYSVSGSTIILNERKGFNETARRASSISKSSFISTIGKIARKDCKRTGILASVTIAQAILESGWGKSSLAKNANNLFGIKTGRASHNWKDSAWDGINSRHGYRKYSCIEDSIADHSAYLRNSLNGARYRGITKTKSYTKQLQIIVRGGYCTSGSYVSQLSSIIKKYGLTKYDH